MYIFSFRSLKINITIKILSFVLISSLVLACKSDLEPIPEGVLNPDQMTKLLVQIHYYETRTINSGMQLDSGLVMFHYLNQRILKSMKIDTGTVNRSIRFYSNSPKHTAKIYERVVDSLTARNATSNDRF